MILAHHGIKGQKWGVRRFENKDGSLTPAGKKRYGKNLNLKEYSDLNREGWNVKNGPISTDPDDYVFKKGSKVQRLTGATDEKFKDRTYVTQGEAHKYLENANEEALKETVYLDEYTLVRDSIIAGKKTVERILNEINPYYEINSRDKLGQWAKNYSYDKLLESDYVNDLMLNDTKLRRDFTARLKGKGYDGMVDPVDSNILLGAGETAVIFVNDVLKKYGHVQMNNFK